MSQHPISVNTGKFNLDVSGVAGFFGGDEAVQAISTIHLYRARRWTGWYNAPGSFAVAKFLGPIADSRFWNALFPGPNQDPETVFGLDNHTGPKYIASQSGTILNQTTHVAYLVTQQSKEESISKEVRGRITKPMTVAIMDTKSPNRAQSGNPPTITVSVRDHNKWWASVPILTSLSACAGCAYNRDWYCFAMILLGIISNGMTCLFVGSASAILEGVKPVDNAPPGDGMLMDDSSNHIVILRGKEEDVNWITKGKFRIEYLPYVWMKKKHPNKTSKITLLAPDADEEKVLEQKSTTPKKQESITPKEYRSIGMCGLLLGIQSLLQLLLIPQGTLFGTRTSAAVFSVLILQPPSDSDSTPEKASIKLLEQFVPNDTPVWKLWREHVGKQITATANWTRDMDLTELNNLLLQIDSGTQTTGLSEEDQELLKKLLGDGCDAFKGYYTFLKTSMTRNNSGKKSS